MSFAVFLRNQVRSALIQVQVRSSSCWSCGSQVEKLVSHLFCSECNALQKPNEKDNYFVIMGVDETYNVNEQQLAKKYKELQKFLHPDKFGNKNKQEQEISEKYSSLVNEAYKTLLEPLSRGIYMLRLRGKEIPEKTEVLDQEFLMKIMEKNEEVENAETEEEIMMLNEENKKKMEEYTNLLSQAFYDGNLKQVIQLLTFMKYYTSIDQQIQNAIRSKGIIR